MLNFIKTSIFVAILAKIVNFGLDQHMMPKQTPSFLLGQSFCIFETHRYSNNRKNNW